MSAREVALMALGAVERQDAWSNGYLKKAIAKEKLDRRDAALATKLVLGTLQNKLLIDFYIGKFSSMKLHKMESKVRDTLRLGVYQLLFLSKIPANAAVNEGVKLTKRYSKNPRAPGMVNGILRSVARSLTQLPTIDRKEEGDYHSIRYSHPKWLVEEFSRQLDGQNCTALLEWNNGEAPTSVQWNLCRAEPEEIRSVLEAEQVGVKPHPWLPNCAVLTGTGNLEQLKAFEEGLFYVQDPAAKLAVLAAGITAGNRVLDACAAPGGKSFAAAIQMENKGCLIACDVYPHKKKLIEAGAQRLGLSCIEARVQDAAQAEPQWKDSFDVVIADVPCSGLGVIRKKPEIRYKNPELMKSLPTLQGAILNTVADYVKPGGVLLYATCTLRREENQNVIGAFLEAAPGFALEAFTLPGPVGAVQEGQVTLWPHETDTDGFFIAKLRRAR